MKIDVEYIYPAVENILKDGIGKVTLIDSMGSDQSVVKAARVSFATPDGKPYNENLLRYLMRHKHTSPFEMVEFQFELTVPLFVFRQILRTRTANLNEQSGRYSVLENNFYVPKKHRMTKAHKFNKQASGDEMLSNKVSDTALELIDNISVASRMAYETLLDVGLNRETARLVLPVNQYVKSVWKLDLNNMLKFLSQRISEDAQWETQQYAKAMLELIRPLVPDTIKAWEDYVYNSITFSYQELYYLFSRVDLDYGIELINKSDSFTANEKIEIAGKVNKIKNFRRL